MTIIRYGFGQVSNLRSKLCTLYILHMSYSVCTYQRKMYWNDAETHPPWFVDLLLVVHDSILPGQVQELQDDGQPSKNGCFHNVCKITSRFKMIVSHLDKESNSWCVEILCHPKGQLKLVKPFRMKHKLFVIDDHTTISPNLLTLGIHVFHLSNLVQCFTPPSRKNYFTPPACSGNYKVIQGDCQK